MMMPINYLVEMSNGRGPIRDKWAWFNTVYDASVFGSINGVAPTNRSQSLPDGVEGKDYLICHSNYL
jgi:hypothetical protein